MPINHTICNAPGPRPRIRFACRLGLGPTTKRKEKGSALISALFIMTLIAIAATAMSTRLQVDIYRTRLTISSDKLYLASQAITFWAMDRLTDPKQRLTAHDTNGKLLDYPKQLQRIYPDVNIEGHLYDLQARFNLNNLQDKTFQLFFYGLLDHALKKTDASARRFIVDATSNWINSYQPERGRDTLSYRYTKQKPPYLPGYQPMQNVSEFRMVIGINAELFQAISPYITALPEVTPININTAPKPLLMALGNGLNPSQVSELMDARGKKGFTNLAEVSPLLQKLNIPNDQVTTDSNYFLSVAITSTQDLTMTVYSILKRGKEKKGTMVASIISESLNTV